MTRDVAAELDAAYARLPQLECKGMCSHSCGPIRMTEVERDRIAARGVDIPDGTLRGPLVCPALTMLNRCAVYDVRPTICRLWGMVDKMRCPHGCEPDGGMMTDGEAYDFMREVFDITGAAYRERFVRLT